MPNNFSSKWKKFVRRHSRHKKRRGERSRTHRRRKYKSTRKTTRGRRYRLKNIGFGRKPTKPPSSLSIFPDKSPQLQKSGEATKLNVFTTKNVALRDSKGREFNAIINGRLAYRRAPRGQDAQNFSDTLYGPPATLLTAKNFKQLKKGDIVYYDRGSVVLRGPFIFKGHRRGPELLFEIKDAVYDKKYLFSIATKRLKEEKLYMVSKKNKSRKKGGKRRRAAHGGN